MAERKFTSPSNHVKDISGRRFSKLTVVSCAGVANSRVYWNCRCDCGNLVVVLGTNIKNNSTKSCGCYMSERLIALNTKHGLSRTREYKSWLHAKERCFDPDNKSFKNYGGRGITMCDAWKDSFECFMSDMGPCADALTLDRINNDGNYEPGNCRWASRFVQCHNRRNSRK